jgi:hypothetical protein
MVQHNALSEQDQNRISRIFSCLQVSRCLRNAGIRKSYGYSCFVVFQSIFQLVFQGLNLYRTLESKHAESLPGKKDVHYRFLNEPRYNWRRFYRSLCTKMVARFEMLTSPQRVRVFVVDDTPYGRERSKEVELLARIYDHVSGKYIRGFTLLNLGWSDGFSFVPVDFTLLSSAKEENRYCEMKDGLDKRTCGYKRRQEALIAKPKAVTQMIDRAIKSGIAADYLLMDSWFTMMPLVKELLGRGMHVIGRVKNMHNWRYLYQGQALRLGELFGRVAKKGKGEIIGSLRAKSTDGMDLKFVFVRNRNKRNEWIAILTTDTALEDQEIVRIYGMRWSIEPFHKVIKSHLKLGKEFEGRSFDMMISHTTIVFTRYLVLEWERRDNNDDRTCGGIFYLYCDEVRDMALMTAMRQLMVYVFSLMSDKSAQQEVVCQVYDWIEQLPSYIKALWPLSLCES